MSKLRPEANSSGGTSYCPTGGTAYLMVYNAVKSKDVLIRGSLHAWGESCAIGSFWDVNPKVALKESFVDEVAAVNDSVPHETPRQRRLRMLRWLKVRLAQYGLLETVERQKKCKASK